TTFVVVINRDGIRESILLTATQDFWREWEQLVEIAAAPASVLPVSFPSPPSIVFAVADDIDLFDVVHADVGGEHGAIGIPRQPMCIAETIGVNLPQCFRIAVRREFVGHRDCVIPQALHAAAYGWTARIKAQDRRHDGIQALGLRWIAGV